MSPRLGVAVALVFFLLGAAEAAKKDQRREDDKAIDKVADEFLAAIHRKDAKAAAALFTPDGDWINPAGQLVRGREAIERELGEFFGEPGRGKLVTTRLQARFLAPTVAVVDGTSQSVPAQSGPPAEHRHTVMLVKQDGRWQIAGIRAAVTFPPSNYERLKGLEWLVGTWRYAKAGAEPEVMESAWEWTDNKNFLEHQFSVRVNNQTAASGTERIGWDAKEQKIKSWLFHSNGSVLEGTWSREGDRWLIQRKGSLEDGTPVSSVDVIAPDGPAGYRFHSTKRTAGDKAMPDRGPVELKRPRPGK